jgi:hypothetical protein
MILEMLEKFGFVSALLVLYARTRISWLDAQASVPDFMLVVLFIVAFEKKRMMGEPAGR